MLLSLAAIVTGERVSQVFLLDNLSHTGIILASYLSGGPHGGKSGAFAYRRNMHMPERMRRVS